MPSCVVKSCKNYASKLTKSQGITYHTFPRDRYRKDDWVHIIQNCRGETDWKPSSGSTVCSAHFDDADFKTTAKGLRCLASSAIPKRLLSNHPEIQAQSAYVPILQKPVLPEKFVLTGYCRLCATSDSSGKLINFQSDNALKNLVVNMSNRLNTNIDFSQENLPTTICSVCVKMLYTAYDFVVGIDLAQTTLNNIFMQKYKCELSENGNLSDNLDFLQQTPPNKGQASYDFEQHPFHVPSTTIILSEVKIEVAESDFEKSLSVVPTMSTPVPPVSSNIDVAAKDFEQPWLHVPSISIPLPQVSPNIGAATSKQNYSAAQHPPLLESSSSTTFSLNTPLERQLKYDLGKQRLINDNRKKKIKILNQKVRRLNKQNESLENKIKKN